MCVTNRPMKTLHNTLALKLTTNVLFRRFSQWKFVYANIIITILRCLKSALCDCGTFNVKLFFFFEKMARKHSDQSVCALMCCCLYVFHVEDFALMLSSAYSTFEIFKTYESHSSWFSGFYILIVLFILEFCFIQKPDLRLTWSATVYRCAPRMHLNKKRTNSKHILLNICVTEIRARNKEYCFWFCYVFTFVCFFLLQFISICGTAALICIFLSIFYLFIRINVYHNVLRTCKQTK